MPIIQGVVGCAFLLWFAVQDWPSHLVVSLLALPFPALLIFGGLVMLRRERDLKPKRKAYLDGNEAARQEWHRARVIKWGVPAAGIVAVVVLVRSLPGASALVVWIVGGLLLAAIIFPVLYSSLVQHKIEDAAMRAHSGEPQPTLEAQRKRTLWFIGASAIVGGIIAFDQFVDAPISALGVLMFVAVVLTFAALIFAAGAFVWRRLNSRRD